MELKTSHRKDINMIKVRICSVTNKLADEYVEFAQKMGYQVFLEKDPYSRKQYFYVNVLTDPPYWRSSDVEVN